jgi:hypothetical protein
MLLRDANRLGGIVVRRPRRLVDLGVAHLAAQIPNAVSKVELTRFGGHLCT